MDCCLDHIHNNNLSLSKIDAYNKLFLSCVYKIDG